MRESLVKDEYVWIDQRYHEAVVKEDVQAQGMAYRELRVGLTNEENNYSVQSLCADKW